ncbi:MAG: hypothetical protein L6Q40_04280 [Azonexus sp.]|nr:hypothetical protein [Azonexus sp.]
MNALLTAATQNLTFADLSGSEVGQTLGVGPSAQITLDANAAGHGWYIDYTPYLNDEYLPTSNPLEWIAKPGSEAEGKMDLLPYCSKNMVTPWVLITVQTATTSWLVSP